MSYDQDAEARVDQLIEWYGDGTNGASPTRRQWRRVIDRPIDSPVTLVNFFRLREWARYDRDRTGVAEAGTGQDAFDRYAEVSIPTLAKVGGRFLLVAPVEGTFVGEQEDWDIIAVGSYPDSASLLALLEDADYRRVFHHRTAACERQRVIVCSG